ncbi:MAG TPA: hypothetical protein VJQ47_08755 [Steroidobacteraceae bacterium]|nr:hypothetical protein [Steroidobacteraceae bacterium]
MRQNLERTQFIPPPAWESPRVHLLDDVWLLTIFAMLFAAAFPWFATGFTVEVGKASWGMLALGGVHICFTILAGPTRAPGAWRDRLLTLLELVGIALMGFVWRHVGGLQNPLFLATFMLPVIGAIFISRRHPYLIAATAAVVVTFAMLRDAPELRWYASGLFGGREWITALFGNHVRATQPSFADFNPPSSYLVVLLEVFTLVLFACAVAADYLGTLFERLNTQVSLARTEAEHSQEMWAGMVERLPLPALLVDPDTLRIVSPSDLAVDYLSSGEAPLEGRNLLDALTVSYPDVLTELINGADSIAQSVIRVAGQVRVVRMRAVHVAHKGRRFALLTIEDSTELFCANAALDTSEYAALVIDAHGRILSFNKPAGALFATARVGADAALLVVQPAATRWWEPGLTGRRKMHIEIGSRVYQVTSSAVALEGEAERIFTVSLLPVAKASNSDPFGTSTTSITQTLGQLR